MKKIYLVGLSLFAFCAANAQLVKMGAGHSEVKEKVSLNYDELKQAAIWTDDFSNPGNWSMNNSSNPALDWQIITAAEWPSTLTQAPLESTSGGNFAFIDSDGAGQSATQNANLVLTTPIDLSAYPLVSVTFENFHRRFQETHTLGISTDGGTTWNEIEVNALYEANTESPNPELVLVDISEFAGGQSSVLLRFNFSAAWDWFWALDDICIIETPEDDMIMREVFVGDVPGDYEYQAIPLNQAHEQVFGAEFSNIGALDQNNVVVTATVTTPTGTESFSTTLTSLPKGADTTVWFPGITVSEEGVHSASFTVESDGNEFSPMNNTMVKNFEVTDGLFGQAFDWSSTFLFDSEAGGAPFTPLTIGQCYRIYNPGDMAYGILTIFPNSQGDFSTEQFLTTTLYQFLDNEAPDPANMTDVQVGEFEVAAGDLSASAADPVWVYLPFDGPLDLTAGEIYFASIDVPGGSDQYNIPSNGDNADAGCFIYGDVDNSGSEQWVAYTNVNIPVVLVLDPTIGLPENVVIARKTNVYPNPVVGIATIDLKQGESLKSSVEVLNAVGQLVGTIDESVAQSGNGTIKVDLTSFSTGIYTLKFKTNLGVYSNKVIVE